MRFAKYHGLGNDFVMVADLEDAARLTPTQVARLCDRRFGVGADGFIRVAPGRDGDFFMDYVNADGSVGEMCGNGIRCLALFALDEGLTEATRLAVDTRAGLKTVAVTSNRLVRVDMGAPVFAPHDVPVSWEGTEALHAKLELPDEAVEAACLSMGNPHAVLFVDEPSQLVGTLGPAIERHPMFPHGTNVEFVRVSSPTRIDMRVWERGVGETLACGTGACAAMVAARALGLAEDRVTVGLPGGELTVEWAGSLTSPRPVHMSGPAVRAFAGEVVLEALA